MNVLFNFHQFISYQIIIPFIGFEYDFQGVIIAFALEMWGTKRFLIISTPDHTWLMDICSGEVVIHYSLQLLSKENTSNGENPIPGLWHLICMDYLSGWGVCQLGEAANGFICIVSPLIMFHFLLHTTPSPKPIQRNVSLSQ